MAEPLREGVVARPSEPVLSGEVECDEVHVMAGHQGRPEAVNRAGRRRRLKGARGRGTLATEKPPIFGLIQRGGAVVIRRVECTRRKAFGCCAVPGCDPIAGSRKRNRRCIWASFRLCITSAAGVKTCSAPCSPCWLRKQTELTGIHIEPNSISPSVEPLPRPCRNLIPPLAAGKCVVSFSQLPNRDRWPRQQPPPAA